MNGGNLDPVISANLKDWQKNHKHKVTIEKKMEENRKRKMYIVFRSCFNPVIDPRIPIRVVK